MSTACFQAYMYCIESAFTSASKSIIMFKGEHEQHPEASAAASNNRSVVVLVSVVSRKLLQQHAVQCSIGHCNAVQSSATRTSLDLHSHLPKHNLAT